jgi:hypothetical protein
VVHRGPGWEARSRSDDTDADEGESGDWHLDNSDGQCCRSGVPSREPGDRAQETALSEKVVWQLLQRYTATAGVPGSRRLLLGRASVQTKGGYLGAKQDLLHPPNDRIKLRVVV